MGGLASSPKSTFSVPPDPTPPVPILATITAPGFVTLTFDQPLIPGPSNVNNYFVRRTNVDREPVPPATIAGSAVSFTSIPDRANVGPDVISFSAFFPDIIGVTGLPAAAFVDFPLTAIP